jgi:hypothetical protein
MTLGPKVAAYATSGLLLVTGTAWLLLDRFAVVEGEFGPAKHPLEAWMLRLHGGVAVVMVWLLGWLWATHVRPHFEARRNRWSGSVVAAVNAVLVLSGYLLYYVGSERVRGAVSLVHWGLGVLSPLPLILHVVTSRKTTKGETC